MGFNIGGLISGLAPVIGGLIGGPAGGALGSLLGATASAFTRPPAVALASAVVPSPAPLSIGSFGFRGLPVPRGPSGPALPLPFFGLPNGNNGQPRTRLQSILDAASSAAGKRVTSKDVVNAAKVCGLETAASSFGVSVEDLCFVVVHGMRRRRRRGISAADLRRTRSTIRKISNMRRDLKKLK